MARRATRYFGDLTMWQDYTKMAVSSKPEVQTLPRLSLTGDIVSHRKCPRQYGFFSVKGFVPAHTVQIFYGTIIHEVLDRTHHHFQGYDDPKTKGKIPTNQDIKNYFEEVDNALKAHGIRAINTDLKEKALQTLIMFNQIEGPNLYPLVVDTEHRVRGTRESVGYIMEGVVDVLVGSDSNIEKGFSDPSKLEIWDYKGQKSPKNETDIDSYKYQMQVYCALFRIRNGCLPKAAKLYFLNELQTGITERPKNAILEVKISEKEINKALSEFDNTAGNIIHDAENERWNPPSALRAKEMQDTCTICDIRWSCKAWLKQPFPMQYP